MDELELPPMVDVAEIQAVQEKLSKMFDVWARWVREREAWRLAYEYRSALGDLAYLYEVALRLAVSHPERAVDVERFVAIATHEGDRRKPLWFGQVSEDQHQAAYFERKRVIDQLQLLFGAK